MTNRWLMIEEAVLKDALDEARLENVDADEIVDSLLAAGKAEEVER